MSEELKALTDEQLIEELHSRFEHVEIHLCKEITSSMCICHDKYKGDYDPELCYVLEEEENGE